jgi:hypothetical protein
MGKRVFATLVAESSKTWRRWPCTTWKSTRQHQLLQSVMPMNKKSSRHPLYHHVHQTNSSVLTVVVGLSIFSITASVRRNFSIQQCREKKIRLTLTQA